MKKPILLIVLAIVIISISAFGFVNSNLKKESSKTLKTVNISSEREIEVNKIKKAEALKPADFYIDYGTRFEALSKASLDNIKDISTFLRTEDLKLIKKVKAVDIIQIINDEHSDIKISGDSENLNESQIDFLKKAPYSTSFVVNVAYERHNNIGNSSEQYLFTPHYTISPKIHADYKEGKQAFINILYNQTQFERLSIVENKLKPAKLYFTVTKEGMIKNANLDRSSGYSLIDQKIKGLLELSSGSWIAAKDANGNAVDQELVIYLGLGGC